MKQVKVLVITVLLASASWVAAEDGGKSKLTMQKAETFSHAGVVISLRTDLSTLQASIRRMCFRRV